MSYPAYSYLSSGVLAKALELARELRQAESDVSNLSFGASVPHSLGVGGRAADKRMAVEDWVGAHHDTFEQLFENEQQSATDTMVALGEEADAWAEFWATATNARADRLHDEAMEDHRNVMRRYQDRVADYNDAVAEDPDNPPTFSIGPPPNQPGPPQHVTTPVAYNNYAATG